MRYLIILFTIFFIGCSTEAEHCDEYTLQEHNYYAGDGYSVFINKSDSIGVHLESNEIEQYKIGQQYTLCFEDEGVTIN